MNTRTFILSVSLLVLLLNGCEDSRLPLSDPMRAELDDKLMGVWRLVDQDGSEAYYHIGRVGQKFPHGVLRVVMVGHDKANRIDQSDVLTFSTKLGDSSFINVLAVSQKRLQTMLDEGWPKDVEGYFFLKYKLEGDSLQVWAMDATAKKQAIESGKIKGVIDQGEYTTRVRFSETPDNVAAFIRKNEATLFPKVAFALHRVK